MQQTNLIDILSRADTSGINAATDAVQRHSNVLGQAIATAGKAAQAVYSGAANIAGFAGAAVAAFTGASIKAASDFGEQLAIINTIAQTTPDNLRAIGEGIRDAARRSGEPLASMTQGYYDLLSAGVSVVDAQGVLNAAVTLGIGGLATTAQAVDLLTTVINAWGMEAADASRITDVFAVAIDKGKVTADQIANSIAHVASTAATMGVEIYEVAAAYAAMSAAGVKPEMLAVSMRSAMISLQAPTKQLIDAQNELGVSFKDVAEEQGLAEAYRMIAKYAEDTGIPLVRLLGRVEALSYANTVAGKGAGAYNEALAATTAAYEGNGYAAEQAAQRMNTLPRAFGQLRQSINDVMIEWGDHFLAGLVAGVQGIADVVMSVGDWMRSNRELVASWAPVISLVSSILALRVGFGGLFMVMGRFAPMLGGMGMGLGSIFGILSKLAFPVGMIVLAWNLFTRAVENNWAGMRRFAGVTVMVRDALGRVMAVVKSVIQVVGDMFGALTSGGGLPGMVAAWDRGLSSVGDRMHELDNSVNLLGSNMRRVLQAAFFAVARVISSVFGVEIEKVNAVMKLVIDTFTEFGEAAWRLGSVLLPALIDAAGWLVRTLAPLAFVIGIGLLKGLTAVMNVSAGFIEWLTGASTAAGIAREVLEKVVLAVLGFLALHQAILVIEGIATKIKAVADAAIGAIKHVADFAKTLAGIASKTVDFVVSGLETAYLQALYLKDALAELRSKTISLALNGAKTAAESVTTVVDKMKALSGKSVRLGITGSTEAIRVIDTISEKLAKIQAPTIKPTITMPTNLESLGGDLAGGLAKGVGIGLGAAGTVAAISAGLGGALAGVGTAIVAAVGWPVIIAAAIVTAIGLAIMNPYWIGWLGAQFVNLLLLVANGLVVAGTAAAAFAEWLIGMVEWALNALLGEATRLGQRIHDWFMDDVIGKIDIDLTGFLKFDELWDAITAPFAEIGDKFGAFWDELWSGKFDVGAILGALGELGAAIVTAPVNLFLGVGEWILGKFGDVIGWVGDRIGDAGGAIWNWITVDMPAAINAWMQSIDPFAAIGDWLEQNLPDLDLGAWWDEVVRGFGEGEAFAALTGPDSPLGGFIAWLGTDFGPAIEAIGPWWSGIWADVGKTVTDIWNGILSTIGGVVAAIIGVLITVEEALPGDPNSEWMAKLEAAQLAAENWGNGTTTAISDTASSIGKSMDGAAKEPVKLSDAMDAGVARAAQAERASTAVVEAMKTNQFNLWRQMEGNALTGATNTATNTTTGLNTGVGPSGTAGRAISGSFRTGVNNADTRLAARDAGETVADKAKAGLGSKNASSGGRDLISSWVTGITNYWNSVKSWVSGIATTVAGWFGNSLPTDGPLAGGIASGGASVMKSWIDGLISAGVHARSVAASIVGGVADEFATTLALPNLTLAAPAFAREPLAVDVASGSLLPMDSARNSGTTQVFYGPLIQTERISGDDDVDWIADKLARRLRLETPN